VSDKRWCGAPMPVFEQQQVTSIARRTRTGETKRVVNIYIYGLLVCFFVCFGGNGVMVRRIDKR
jgi:hypothetical protein